MNASQSFQFRGEAAEYFRIWIVNLFLSIVTLGIYSAWAKVRNKQYFYGNTMVAGSAFEYSADPIMILKGRLLVVAILLLFSLFTVYYPLLDLIYYPLFFLILPWLVLRGLMFNARYSSYRNLHFAFVSGLGRTYAVVLGLGLITPMLIILASYSLLGPVLDVGQGAGSRSWVVFILGATLLSLFIWWVLSSYYLQHYYVNHSHYSRLSFAMMASLKQFFIFFSIAALGFSIALILFLSFKFSVDAGDFLIDLELTYTLIVVSIMLLYLRTYLKVRVFNQVWGMTRLMDAADQPPTQLMSFHTELKVNPLFFVYLTNIIASSISLGLLIPWARVRLARYQINRMTLLMHGDLDRIITDEKMKVGSFGGEMGDLLDIDIGL
jgi:uncharacterized membrane protein YjgN (DUF898 family)